MSTITIRPALAADVPLILDFIRRLADYENLSQDVSATEQQLLDTLFAEKPAAEALLAYADGQPAGLALYFQNYSTFLARPGIYLEDLFVLPALRGRGIGRALLAEIARIAVARGCGRFEWAVLDWNAPAIGFYESLGARAMNEWTVYRLSGDALEKLAAEPG